MSTIKQLDVIEQNIRELSDRRQLLKGVLNKIKAERPAWQIELMRDAPVRKMFSEKFNENKSIAQKINFILSQQKDPMTSSEVTTKYINLVPGSGGKNRNKTLKNISTILSIGNDKKYKRNKSEELGKYTYTIKEAQLA